MCRKITLVPGSDEAIGKSALAGITALDLGRKVDVRDLPQQDGASLDGGNDDVAQVFQTRRAPDIPDEKFAGILGPAVFAVTIAVTGSSRGAILSVIGFFVIGAVLLSRVDVAVGREEARRALS